ncbi:MAG TPA: hypothetical protein P5210_02760 [Draconibacterium sp.]|nr:hypothetical protein [Draconibacterium sp.]HRX10540.1 hypothetical protein [Draconibacterium sp.]
MKKTILFAIALFAFNPTFSQKKVINREIAQLNYDGYQLMLAENYKEAIKLFNLAVEGDPEAFFIYQNRALCHLFLGDTANAILDFRKNLKFEPENTECLYNIGNICKKQKDTINAVQYFKKSLQFAGSDFSEKKLIYMNQFLGNSYFEKNHFDSALVYFNYLKSADSLNSGNFINSAVCNYKINNSEGFCADLERAFELGGAITCQFLKYYCNGCDNPGLSGKMSAPNSNALDKRLEFLFQNAISQNEFQKSFFIPEEIENRKVKVYFNSKWQICPPEKAMFYRESFWSMYNFFGGSFKDYFITGEILSEGTINEKNYEGLYKSYFKNGQTQTIGRFRNGIPVGKWVFFNENGKTDYEIEFEMDDFSLRFLNTENTDYKVFSGSGSFKVIFEKIDGLDYALSGAFQNNKKQGDWKYMLGNDIAIFEQYRDGKFKKGYANTTNGKANISESVINSSLLIPPHLFVIGNLYFESINTVNFYPFIRTVNY